MILNHSFLEKEAHVTHFKYLKFFKFVSIFLRMISYFFVKPVIYKGKKELLIRAIPEDDAEIYVKRGWIFWEYYFENHPEECEGIIY